jgi:glycosyltransferase involved in cell wall biosynthesis
VALDLESFEAVPLVEKTTNPYWVIKESPDGYGGKRCPKISVLMSVYNGERFLQEAIDSILAQTYKDFELIIVDDASSDGTQQILDSYSDPRIVRFRNEKNLGIGKSLALATAIAKAHYFAKMDADDISEPDRFRIQCTFLDNHPDISAVGSTAIHIDESGHETGRSTLSIDDLLPWDLIWGNPIYHGSVMIRAAAFFTIGGYDPTFRLAVDYDLWLRMISAGQKIATLNEPLLRYRIAGPRVTTTQREVQDQFAKQALRRYLCNFIRPEEVDVYADAFWAFSRRERPMVQGEIDQVLKLVRDIATVTSARNFPVERKRVHMFLAGMFLTRAGSWAATSAHTSWSATVAAIHFYPRLIATRSLVRQAGRLIRAYARERNWL